MQSNSWNGMIMKVATDALREILLYHKIGTVEECRIAVEKQKQETLCKKLNN